jgi:hypothetical protein
MGFDITAYAPEREEDRGIGLVSVYRRGFYLSPKEGMEFDPLEKENAYRIIIMLVLVNVVFSFTWKYQRATS